ncbi:MAG: hypothetical protein WCT03_19565 [Candidatus Obscuribacterales bacterium]
MKRSSVIIVIFCALGLGVFCLWKTKDDSNTYEGRGPIVFAIRDIKVGSLITSACVEERILPVSKMPDHAVCRVSEVIGCKPIYGIEKGQILSQYDFLPPERVLEGSKPPKFIEP